MKKSLVTAVAVVCVTALSLFAGCENQNANQQAELVKLQAELVKQQAELEKTKQQQADNAAFTRIAFGGALGGAPTPTPSASQVPKAPAREPSDEELIAIITKKLKQSQIAKFPVQFTSVTVNWNDKSADGATGRYSAKAKALEGFYKKIDTKDALKELGFAQLYEGELSIALERVGKFAEPYKSNLRSAAPKEKQMENFRFYTPILPTDEEVTITGRVEFERYGDDWESGCSIVIGAMFDGESFYLESTLTGANRLDDPKTKSAVEAVLQERKDFIAKVNERTNELDAKRLAVLKKQRDDFDKYCKPGMTYEGSFKWRSTSGSVRVAFVEYATNDKSTINGTISFLKYTDFKLPFTVSVTTNEVVDYPVYGNQTFVTGNSYDFAAKELKIDRGSLDYDIMGKLIETKPIRINFTDKKMNLRSGDTYTCVFDLPQ